MVDSQQGALNSNAQSDDHRSEYTAPKLMVFGAVGALTQAGSQLSGEGTVNMMGVFMCMGGMKNDPMC
jgi:hypothetical protein